MVKLTYTNEFSKKLEDEITSIKCGRRVSQPHSFNTYIDSDGVEHELNRYMSYTDYNNNWGNINETSSYLNTLTNTARSYLNGESLPNIMTNDLLGTIENMVLGGGINNSTQNNR